MLSTEQLREHLTKVTYKPGWSFTVYDGEWEGQHIVIRTVVHDAYDPTKTTALDVHSMLPPMDSIDQFNNWLMWRLGRIEVHEMREFFRVNGTPVSDPHKENANRDTEFYCTLCGSTSHDTLGHGDKVATALDSDTGKTVRVDMHLGSVQGIRDMEVPGNE